jgi:L-2,4-diaminobutyrate decarboxylase
MGPAADAIFTSGGSLGNLTALLAARTNKAAYAWDEGSHAGPPLAVLTSRAAHYSVDRAVRMLGWGAGGVVPVAVDHHLRMDVSDLDAALARARDAGRHPIAVVATAGGVPIGSFDPLDRIADVCARNGLWLHVDAAHGGAAVLSKRYRHLVAGIERADSVVWDAHKMLLMPSLMTAVVFRDAATSYRTFAQDASYLLHDSLPAWADSCTRTVECTKNAMAFKLYCTLATLGAAVLTEYVERMFDLGARLAGLIEASGDFELATPPTCNIVMFRYRPADASDLDAVQRRVVDRLRANGTFFIVDAELAGARWLRTVLMNPLTTERDLTALLDHVRATAG